MSYSPPAGHAAVLQQGFEPLAFGVPVTSLKVCPQAESQLTNKDFAKQKYAQKKRNPARFNKKEERARKTKLIGKLVHRVEELARVEIKPHAFTDTLEPLQAFIGDLGKYLVHSKDKRLMILFVIQRTFAFLLIISVKLHLFRMCLSPSFRT